MLSRTTIKKALAVAQAEPNFPSLSNLPTLKTLIEIIFKHNIYFKNRINKRKENWKSLQQPSPSEQNLAEFGSRKEKSCAKFAIGRMRPIANLAQDFSLRDPNSAKFCSEGDGCCRLFQFSFLLLIRFLK